MVKFPFTLFGGPNAQAAQDPSAGQTFYEQPLIGSVFEDIDIINRFHDVMMYLVPTDDLQVTAFDDYYPTAFYCLGRLGKHGEHAIYNLRTARQKLFDILSSEQVHDQYDLSHKLDDFFRDNIRFFAFLAVVLDMPAKTFQELDAAADFRIAAEQPIKDDLKHNTRRGSFWHDKGVEDFIRQVKRLQKRYNYHFSPSDPLSPKSLSSIGRDGLDIKV